VVDQLRLFLNQPLRDADRPRLFAVAVVVIIAAGGLLALLHDPAPARHHGPGAASAPTAVAGGGLPAPTAIPSQTPVAASEKGRPAASSAGSRADVATAKRAARQFVSAYLPYSYGHGRPTRIPAATAALSRRLTRARPRVPARERRLHPRLVLLQSDAVGHRHAQLLALIDDGARRYTLQLELSRSRGSWTVADVGA
jgi:hypothetical protein